jgi:parallel beta-helix repeat protein
MKVSPRVLLIAMIAFASPALATNFYTSTTGSDVSNNCNNIASPCNLRNGLLYEFSQVIANRGDTIYMCAGACDGSGSAIVDMAVSTAGTEFRHVPSGTSRATAMTVMPYPGESITWKPSAGNAAIYLHDGVHYTTWKNFTLDGSLIGTGFGMYIGDGGGNNYQGNGYHRFENMTVQNWPGVAVFTVSPYNEFVNNTLQNNGRNGIGHGYYICGSSQYPEASSYTLIDGGEVYDTYTPSYYNRYGVHVYNNTGAGQYPSSHVTVRNLKVHNYNHGILVMGGTDNYVYNNIVYDNLYYGLYAFSGGTVYFYNNTVVGNGYNAATNQGPTAYFINNNFWGNFSDSIEVKSGTVTQSSNLILTDPLFVDPSKKDFHLQGMSPAIGKGSNLSSVFTNDNEGNRRPLSGAWDIGAYENSPLIAPGNLTIPQVR